ncbi:MAG: 30S ribosomal protein S6 [Candidatus Omnitrophica bacterium]|nr:30S ribosomal protein S6 [Candidatus Omnitrophota bacterium]
MENKVLIRKYELVTIIDAKLTNDQKEAICKEVVEILQKVDAKVINSQVWFEKHKFSFDIKRCKEGTYYLTNFESPASSISKIRAALRLKEKVLRFEIIKNEKT